MSNLPQDLELLRALNENRSRAKELREQALHALKQIGLEVQVDEKGPRFKYKDKDQRTEAENNGIDFERWVAADDDMEIALLVKVQNHRELSNDETENNSPIKTSSAMTGVLTSLGLKELLPEPGEAGARSSFPVLLAARAMQSLVNRAETVFEPATMYCYYRIIRELYGVAHPNWTVGAARAGVGGTTSAFVTNECVRAIFAFQNALKRTYEFFTETRSFYEYFSTLNDIIEKWQLKECSPALYDWANKSIKARWLDCQIATNPRNREMALFYPVKPAGKKASADLVAGRGQARQNELLLPDDPGEDWIEKARSYFEDLPKHLAKAVNVLNRNVKKVHREVEQFRKSETPHSKSIEKDGGKRTEEEKRKEERVREEKITKFNRTQTAHLFALKTIKDAVRNAGKLQEIIKEKTTGEKNRPDELFEEMEKMFYTIRRRVHHVLEPSKQYLKWVLNRELAAPAATFDAGELAFAATSYGAINNWRMDHRLTRACELLVSSLPETGRLPTRRPFHADRRGYRTIPIGCEMTRSLATLLQKASHGFDAKFVGRMLDVFEEQLIELHESTAGRTLIGWNFEGAPNPEKPAVWVTAVSILALDRIVRMLNTRINEIVLAHFDVTKPERPHTQLTLRDVLYSDYALVKEHFGNDEERLTAIHLQKSRAHVMRATLPERYRQDNRSFSAIYYGPPGTGKTTLAEALALSARVPLLRLSPGDLILQGQELMEGRAHDVFEALSMLTQCVIIFDEFEPVLKNRGNETRGSSSRDRLGRIGDVLQNISEKGDPQFRFVLGGMLPKLLKLHDSAEKQSFAYCLGTNYLSDIDPAAKRKGRFSKKIPVYKPDALSRAGALLKCLSEAKKIRARDKRAGKGRKVPELKRFYEIIARTIGEPADRIGRLFKIESGKDELTATLKYILGEQELPHDLKESKANFETLKAEIPTDKSLDEEEHEKEQREWMHAYEGRFVGEEHIAGRSWKAILERLNERLDPKS